MIPITMSLDDGTVDIGIHRRLGLRRWTACCSVYLTDGNEEGDFTYHKPCWTREAATEAAYAMYRSLAGLRVKPKEDNS